MVPAVLWSRSECAILHVRILALLWDWRGTTSLRFLKAALFAEMACAPPLRTPGSTDSAFARLHLLCGPGDCWLSSATRWRQLKVSGGGGEWSHSVHSSSSLPENGLKEELRKRILEERPPRPQQPWLEEVPVIKTPNVQGGAGLRLQGPTTKLKKLPLVGDKFVELRMVSLKKTLLEESGPGSSVLLLYGI